ncbi:MAG TPA: ABC transporter ATP-binding protein [bacterium]|nr:ABC transporter ATP-binding protein [bacterium]
MFSVEVKNLVVKFGDFAAVDGVSFAVEPGEIFGFLGANGAGKTTTIRVLCGLLTPTQGEVQVAGRDVRRQAEEVKARVGYMSQRFTLYYDLTVEENLSFAASLRKLERGYTERRKAELLKFIGFQFPMKTLVKDLPGGLKQEVSLAAAMLHDPDVIFLDEPTAGVTPAARLRFWNLIQGLASRGKTVFVTTHYMDEAEQCGRVALMGSGRIFAMDSPEKLKRAVFPEPLYEIEPLPGAPLGWWKELEKGKAVKDLKPFGLRYHALAGEPTEWEAAIRSLEGKAVLKRIQPSLEDVFVRVLEGGKA